MNTLLNILYLIGIILICFKLIQWFVEVPNYLKEINENLKEILSITKSKEDNKDGEDDGVEL